MPEMPWEMIGRSQRAAAGLLADTVASLVEMGRAGVTRPDEVVAQVSALAGALGDLAGSTARPLEFFLESQRQLAETMSAFAVLQRQLADVLETAATNHAAIVQALEMMTSPVIGVAQRVRTDADSGTGEPAGRDASDTKKASAKKTGAKKTGAKKTGAKKPGAGTSRGSDQRARKRS